MMMFPQIHNDDGDLFLWYPRVFSINPEGTIIKDPHQHKPPTHPEQDLSLRKT